ncbi:metal ABC transporter solute-binding protein, Zn/Mn family [Rhizobium halophytocola]|uniref:Zinc/manganese transport system substrate-binding protein n=1 Tax=Rhizobium halophytocola TaxID=735519 RepID=A0ABS4DX73_9HYPH|nr:zinc ABC transporter substrate-binding protein [Rhizobium halophytocola]MBP1850298.1 zinc/manganese transport system substrate-binding protein [Rhizobium halophytocola]
MRPYLLLASLALPLVAGTASARDLTAVASFTVLADVVHQVAGDHVTVESLIGPNGDPHEFEPSPKDAKMLKSADLVFVSGEGLEGWMDRLVTASGFAGTPVTASAGIDTRTMDEDGETITDPHVWNDPNNVKTWVGNIEAALAKADPANAKAYAANAKAYLAKLSALDAQAHQAFDSIPVSERKVLTSHDAFGYFGRAYDVTFLSPVGLSTESEASAAGVAGLIDQIRAEGVKAYFFENSNDPRLVNQIAKATGARPGGELYVESLSDASGPAATYEQMMRYDIQQLAKAMKGNS